MDLATILKLIQTVTDLTLVVNGQVEKAKDVLTSDNADQVNAALKDLRAQNDLLHSRLQTKLDAASKR